MYILFTVLIVIISLILILMVLVQNSKGGGLTSAFASSNQIMGVSKTTDFLEKTTWTLIAFIVVLSILTTHYIGSQNTDTKATQLSEEAQGLQQQTAGNPLSTDFNLEDTKE